MKFGIFLASGIVISVRSFLTKTMTFIDARMLGYQTALTLVRFMSSSSCLFSSSFPFQSSEFGSISISNRLAQVVWNDDWTRTIILE